VAKATKNKKSKKSRNREMVELRCQRDKEGPHVGLDFYDLLLEALKMPWAGV
jgi:hypothetical protein